MAHDIALRDPGTAFDIALAEGALGGVLGMVAESDAAQAIAWAPKDRLVTTVTESDTAQAIGHARAYTIAQATESDGAQPISHARAHSLALAAETDAPQPLAVDKAKALGLASEGDTAQALSRQKADQVGMASEADSAQALESQKVKALGMAAEADVAQTITPGTAITEAIDTVFEVDTAQPIAWAPKHRLLGMAAEFDQALGITWAGAPVVPPGPAPGPVVVLGGRRKRQGHWPEIPERTPLQAVDEEEELLLLFL